MDAKTQTRVMMWSEGVEMLWGLSVVISSADDFPTY